LSTSVPAHSGASQIGGCLGDGLGRDGLHAHAQHVGHLTLHPQVMSCATNCLGRYAFQEPAVRATPATRPTRASRQRQGMVTGAADQLPNVADPQPRAEPASSRLNARKRIGLRACGFSFGGVGGGLSITRCYEGCSGLCLR